jgi:hypothetical protein
MGPWPSKIPCAHRPWLTGGCTGGATREGRAGRRTAGWRNWLPYARGTTRPHNLKGFLIRKF